jgi:hypothetical protein
VWCACASSPTIFPAFPGHCSLCPFMSIQSDRCSSPHTNLALPPPFCSHCFPALILHGLHLFHFLLKACCPWISQVAAICLVPLKPCPPLISLATLTFIKGICVQNPQASVNTLSTFLSSLASSVARPVDFRLHLLTPFFCCISFLFL